MPESNLHPDVSLSRRRFMSLSALGAGALLTRPSVVRPASSPTADDLRFAIISDVHLFYRPENRQCDPATVSNPEDRYASFVRDAERWGAELLIDLGDLHPASFDEGPGQKALTIWNAWPKEKIAVFGNHDNDNLPKETYLRAMGMPSAYYSKTIRNWTFIVMDSGGRAMPPGLSDEWGEQQLPWLRDEIRQAPGRCVILVHHGARARDVALPPERTKQIIDQANQEAGYQKVVAYFWGHIHQTRVNQSRGVHYVLINSASYRWKAGPWWYRDPAPYAMGMLRARDGELHLEGTGEPGNWATQHCDNLKARQQQQPDDDLTYQASILPAAAALR